jgi:hypothetical protein
MSGQQGNDGPGSCKRAKCWAVDVQVCAVQCLHVCAGVLCSVCMYVQVCVLCLHVCAGVCCAVFACMYVPLCMSLCVSEGTGFKSVLELGPDNVISL